MPFDLPAPDERVLSDAPLDVVVCQLQFDPHLAVPETRTAREFHEAIGGTKGGYPRVEQIQTQNFSVGPLGPNQAPSISNTPSVGWRFSSLDEQWTISLLAESVTLETSGYESWEDFSARLANAFEAAKEVLDPGYERRLGLRYIDRIEQRGNSGTEGWEGIIDSHLLGPLVGTGLAGAIQAAQQHLVISLDQEAEVFCGFRHGFLPEGEARAEAPDAYVLDYDIYRESGRTFDEKGLVEAADEFNRFALQLFQASVTPEYLESVR